MQNIDDFIKLIQGELGLDVTAENIGQDFDEISGWNSVHLLQILTLLERETGRRISFPQMLEAPSLKHIFDIAVAA